MTEGMIRAKACKLGWDDADTASVTELLAALSGEFNITPQIKELKAANERENRDQVIVLLRAMLATVLGGLKGSDQDGI